VIVVDDRPDSCEGMTGPHRKLERLVVSLKRGNASGGKGGHEKRLDAHIVNYADDFVICCKRGVAGKAMTQMRAMMEELKLTVNEKKTRQCSVPSETLPFLGFTFSRRVSWESGKAYLAPAPARKKILGVCDKISEETSRRTVSRSEADQVNRHNPILMGWGSYFQIGYVTGAWQVHVRFDERGVETAARVCG